MIHMCVIGWESVKVCCYPSQMSMSVLRGLTGAHTPVLTATGSTSAGVLRVIPYRVRSSFAVLVRPFTQLCTRLIGSI